MLGEDWADFHDKEKEPAYIINWKSWVNNHAHVLRGKKLILDNKFLCFYLNIFDYHWYVAWATRMKLNQWAMKEIPIPLPPITTQQLIVAKLDETFAQIDEAITTTQANIDQTDELTKSVLDKVFEEGEWEMKKIEKIVEKTELWNPLKKPNEVFDYVDISSIDNKLFSITETKEILGKDAPSRAKKLIEKWDILYATTRPNLKNIALCEINKPNLTCSTWFCVLRTKKKELFNRYLFYYIITDGFFKKIEKYIRGAQYPAVSDKDIKSVEIPLPPLAKQQEIVDYLDRVFAETKQLKAEYEAKLQQLKELKASVLQSAFEGKLV